MNDCLVPTLVRQEAQMAHASMTKTGGNRSWRCGASRRCAAPCDARRTASGACDALQARLGMTRVRLDGVRFGNLNTPEDLRGRRRLPP